jgi:acetylornithine deacetylase/succinyl-diaminopimelate desuccinylase-like protein
LVTDGASPDSKPRAAEAMLRAAEAGVRPAALLDLLRVLGATPSPRGRERDAARRLAAWTRQTWPELDWSPQEVGSHGANLVSRSELGEPSPALLFYSHLDTSLTGDAAADQVITARADPAPLPRSLAAAGLVSGFGLGVARAPLAAATVGYVAAATALRAAGVPHRLELLLASAGTHRAHWPEQPPAEPTGALHHLATQPRPAAVVVAKCGPAGVLYEEPGALYLRVRLRTGFGALLAPSALRPPGGLLAHLGVLAHALDTWRAAHLSARPGVGQLGAQVGTGFLRAGSAHKPDLAPGLLEVALYVVTLPGDDGARIAASLRAHLERELRDASLDEVAVEVTRDEIHPAARTPRDAPVVRCAAAAWRQVHGAPPPTITGWTGSTDGVVFRGAGIDVARVGPRPRVDPEDPRVDVFEVAELLRYARLYARLAVGHALTHR